MSDMFLILIGVLYIALKRSQERILKPEALIILPALFLYFLVQTVEINLEGNFYLIPAVICGLIVGIILGYLLKRPSSIHIKYYENKLIIPANIMNGLSILFIFLVQYLAHYLLAIHHPTHSSVDVTIIILFATMGCASGFTVGQNLCYFWTYWELKKNIKHDA